MMRYRSAGGVAALRGSVYGRFEQIIFESVLIYSNIHTQLSVDTMVCPYSIRSSDTIHKLIPG